MAERRSGWRWPALTWRSALASRLLLLAAGAGTACGRRTRQAAASRGQVDGRPAPVRGRWTSRSTVGASMAPCAMPLRIVADQRRDGARRPPAASVTASLRAAPEPASSSTAARRSTMPWSSFRTGSRCGPGAVQRACGDRRQWSAASALSNDYLAIDGRLDRIRLQVELALAPAASRAEARISAAPAARRGRSCRRGSGFAERLLVARRPYRPTAPI